MAPFFEIQVSKIGDITIRNTFTFLGSSFFWMISISTLIAVLLSFTNAKKLEGVGAS